ncbi:MULTISPECIES: helix-turn-helix domain-containing protein [Actinosynnema]|uniref:helix-turn-helix transcriptional regulator n=1 Tax=Actinosynnema TaxID=40566 RepID=UPI0020A5EC18|nr:helix-turn-helix domain-containing protein [Actinosynnema pretiosum]MCP2095195.1 transcriptional regulator, AlpA family [Actinosynnema pretiosum]
MSRDELLTVAEFCGEFKISRSTLYEWLAKGQAPKHRKLPNGQLRFKRADVDRWFDSCAEAA